MSSFSQWFPPAPTFTERDLGDLTGKVYLITGSATGIGHELAKILYGANATVYIGARSAARCDGGISAIKTSIPISRGTLKPFIADLSDLKTLKPACQTLLAQESRLDVLFLNAGVMTPPPGSKTQDGYDLELGTNCLSSFLLVTLLTPLLTRTLTRTSAPASSSAESGSGARVVWVSSNITMFTPQGGVQLDSNNTPKQFKAMDNYMQTKAGLVLLAHEFNTHQPQDPDSKPITHISLNPGFMRTELQRHTPAPARALMSLIFKPAKYGAYTELYAGFSPDIKSGEFVVPWGRKGCVPDHIAKSMQAAGGKSVSTRFYEWCEEKARPFV
ncbi:short-chain dehydrogenase [Lindgomyces ingoldianus]|uniref:Short-chain dehydrogenase n=1 Tax=Lindgomyces ingoldianus TaxID=673940 RepID=A0ACB6RDT5_9PLEO|nr:short-chain dehydrogenase [Lindgomyces ingoldianus]KAF2476903.1 short-chain dehydrogenase [Lindgomyces ingoldianus]